MTKPKAIICDLDSTLCDNSHRMHHIQGEKKQWKAYNEACVDDTPNQWCVAIIHAMRLTHTIVFVTGRSLEYHDHTIHWIMKHVGPSTHGGYEIYMRPEKDFKPDTEVKRVLYQSHIAERLDVVFCLEDRKGVVEMYRDLGLVCLACAEGDY